MILAILAFQLGGIVPAAAERPIFRTYNADQDLSSLGGTCLTQDHSGYLLVCTEHGVFAFDGRRFVNLGPEQGLRQGGLIFSLAVGASGRIAVGFADELLISEGASDNAHPPTSLFFKRVATPGISFFDERGHRVVAWHDGFVFLAGDDTERIAIPHEGDPQVTAMGYNREEQGLLSGALAVFSPGGHLWETFPDGKLCAAEPGAVKCYGPNDGLRGGPWWGVISDGHGRLLARSSSGVATLDAATNRWTVTALPNQGGRYANFDAALGLFKTPNGDLLTQADSGLAVRDAKGWRLLSVADGAPSGTIVSSVVDGSGQLWFQVLGRGLVRWTGYGHWETVQKTEGLSEGFAWKAVRSPGGPLWVATDTGVDAIAHVGLSLKVTKVLPEASFALAVGPRGELWRGYKSLGIQVVDPATGRERALATPPVNVISTAPDGIVWLGTQRGLFSVDDRRPATPLQAVLQSSPKAIVKDIACDNEGGVYYLANGRLRHRHADGSDVLVQGEWPGGGFDPIVLAAQRKGEVWVGGEGGLYRLTLAGDQLVATQAIAAGDIQTNSVAALMIDHRGWVWVGTASGVSVFDGERWVSIDTDTGLLSADVDENGLLEDADGSVWITTTQGLSHLVDPAWIFVDRPVAAVVSSAFLGNRKVLGKTLPYTRGALTVQFGTPNGNSERSFRFRYSLSGVDAEWGESSSGLLRYPSVPPGHHVLTVIGYDELTHRSSPPATLTIDVAYPWWRQWWSETLWSILAGAVIYLAMHVRFRSMVAREAELQRRIDEATERLQFQAAHDRLTGLLTRSEIEARLAANLASNDRVGEMIVALVDIDHFKKINDAYGHLGGDDVLRAIGSIVRDSLCPGDYAGRYGGEELLLVLSDTDDRGAARVLKLHHLLRGTSFAAAGNAIRLTCSIGVAWARRGDDWESLIGRADKALYEAKETGRDQVIENRRVIPPHLTLAEERRRGRG